MLDCNPYPNPPAPMTDDERRAYHARRRASVATLKAHVKEKHETLLRSVGALDNQRPFEVSIEEAREAHPLLESDLDALDETTLDRIREQRYAAWGDSPTE